MLLHYLDSFIAILPFFIDLIIGSLAFCATASIALLISRSFSAPIRATIAINSLIALLVLPLCMFGFQAAGILLPIGKIMRPLERSQQAVVAVIPNASKPNIESNGLKQSTNSITKSPRNAPTFIGNAIKRIPAVFMVSWLLVAAILILRIAFGLTFLSGYRSGLRLVDAENIPSIASRIAKSLGMNNVPPVYSSATLASPICTGILRPIAIFPERLLKTISNEDLEAILYHEFSHIRSFDHVKGLVQRIALAAYWWNPFLHWISTQYSVAAEEISDTHAIVGLKSQNKYAEILVDLAQRTSLISRLPATVCMASPYLSIEKRIKNILTKEREMNTELRVYQRIGLPIFSVSLMLICGAISATNAPASGASETKLNEKRCNQEAMTKVPVDQTDGRFSKDALVKAFMDGIHEMGLQAEITNTDCSEFPCLIGGYVKGDLPQFWHKSIAKTSAFARYSDLYGNDGSPGGNTLTDKEYVNGDTIRINYFAIDVLNLCLKSDRITRLFESVQQPYRNKFLLRSYGLALSDRGMTIHVKYGEIYDLLKLITETYKIWINPGLEVKGKISLDFDNIPVERAIETIAGAGGFKVIRNYPDDGIYTVISMRKSDKIYFGIADGHMIYDIDKGALVRDVIDEIGTQTNTPFRTDPEALKLSMGQAKISSLNSRLSESGLSEIFKYFGCGVEKDGSGFHVFAFKR